MNATGSPITVRAIRYARTFTMPVSHQPMKMNQSARTSRPGPSLRFAILTCGESGGGASG